MSHTTTNKESNSVSSVSSVSIDRQILEENIDLHSLIKTIPKNLLVPSELRSWLGLGRVILSVIVMLWVLFQIELSLDETLFWKVPLLILVWFIYGAVLVGFFLVGHDCGHGSFSNNRKVNRIVGYLCMAPLFNGYHSWVLTHNHHHANTQLIGQDVDWSSYLVTKEEFAKLTWSENFAIKLGYYLPFGIFFWIMWNAIQRGSQVGPMLGKKLYERHKKKLILSNLFMLAVSLTIYVVFWYYTGFWGMMKYHGVPLLIASLLGGIFVAIGHANENTIWYEKHSWSPIRGQIVSTYDYRFPSWFEYLVLNINVHIPHHVSVRIPWYNLKLAAKHLQKSYPELYQEIPFKFRDMSWIVKAPFLVKNSQLGYYQMQI